MPRMIADLERAGEGWRSLNLTGADEQHAEPGGEHPAGEGRPSLNLTE